MATRGRHEGDPFEGFELEAAMRQRAADCGLALHAADLTVLAFHAREVLRRNDELHLTTITDPDRFVERHLGESFEGAAMLRVDVCGALLDLGSGNGYPGLALAVARRGLRPYLAEAASRKARFLRAVTSTSLSEAVVLERQIQRALDLDEVPPLRVVTSRAVGGWERIVPRLLDRLAPDGEILVWAGEAMTSVARRDAWRRLSLIDRRPLPGRDRSWIWRFSATA